MKQFDDSEPKPDFEEWAEAELGLPTHKLVSGDYQSFGMACAVKAWKARPAPAGVEQIADFAGFLIDNYELQEVTEERLMHWLSEYIKLNGAPK